MKFLKTLLAGIDAAWPTLKYVAFGIYYAWILICYSSSVLFSFAVHVEGISLQSQMYILSTLALACTLLASTLFNKLSVRISSRVNSSLLAGLIALASMCCIIFGSLNFDTLWIFTVGCVLSGVATAFVALRFGMLHSLLPSNKVFSTMGASMLLAGFIYFVVIGLPSGVGVALCALLPLLAVLATTGKDVHAERNEDGSGRLYILVDGEERNMASRPPLGDTSSEFGKPLPRGFFPSLVVAIAIFSAMAGFYSGLGAEFSSDSQMLVSTHLSNMAVFVVLLAVIAMLCANTILEEHFNMSKLYYPLIVFACFCIIILPLAGGYNAVQYTLIRSSYTLFILFMWTLLAYIAHWSRLNFVKVFGFGRGASALGTAIGWLVALQVSEQVYNNSDLTRNLAIIMAFALIVLSMILLKEDAINRVFSWTENAALAPSLVAAVNAEVAAEVEGFDSTQLDVGGADAEPAIQDEISAVASRYARIVEREDLWEGACREMAEKFNLTSREREVLFLLGRRLTVEQIAAELCVSFNTAKSHVRHIYARCGIHSRKELFTYINTMYND